MSNYIDYVLCQDVRIHYSRHLFKTEAWSGLKAGDVVFVEGYDYNPFYVLAVKTVEKESEVYSFIRTMCDGDKKRRLKGKMTKFKYEEDI